jgi:polysaccharide biosynthesis transport protein
MPVESELWRYLRIVRQRLWLLILLPVVGAMFAFYVSTSVLTPSYTASALVLVAPTSTENFLLNLPSSPDTDRTRTIATAIAILQSTPVAQKVASQFPEYHGDPTLVPSVTGTPQGTTDVISVDVSDPSSRRSAALATAYAKAFLDQKKAQVLSDVQAASAGLQQQIAGLQKQVSAFDNQLAAAAPADRQFVQSTIGPSRQAVISQQSTLRQRLDALTVESSLQTGGVQLIQAAARPTTPTSPRKYFNTALAGVGGLVLAFGIVLLMEILDDRVRSAADVVNLVPEIPILGAVPSVPGWGSWRHRKETRLVALSAPTSAAAEGYRSLRTALALLRSQHGVKSFLVTGPVGREGKTTTAANLAVAMAKAGDHVLLVGADLRHPRLHEFFGLANDRGLSTVITEGIALTSAIQSVAGVSGLFVLTSGPAPADSSDLLSTVRGAQVLGSLKDYADVVIIDAPSVLAYNDAGALSRSVQSVLLTVTVGTTGKRKLVEAVGGLERVDAPLLRIVINQADGVPRSSTARPSASLNGKATLPAAESVEA